MIKYIDRYALVLMAVFCASCGRHQAEGNKIIITSEKKGVITAHGPQWITRNLIQDSAGNIWIAAFDGIFRYDGKSFSNVTSKVSSARFFSVLADRKGNFWFGSIGSGAYYYDGKSFTNFATADGLLNNDVGSIYEDKKGNIWFGVFGGASCYDGKSFRNYIIEGNEMNEDRTGRTFKNRPPYEVTSIIEDKTGKLWFATRGNTFVYDGKAFTNFTNNGKPFKNVRSIIEDKKGNIWLGGAGLWRYDGRTFTNFTQNFVGCVYEDRKGNIWTASQRANEGKCLLSRYDEQSLTNKNPTVIEIESNYEDNKGTIFGILEARDGSICLGTMTGVYRYNGSTITDFKGK